MALQVEQVKYPLYSWETKKDLEQWEAEFAINIKSSFLPVTYLEIITPSIYYLNFPSRAASSYQKDTGEASKMVWGKGGWVKAFAIDI